MRVHSSTGRVNKCHICNKAYLTKSKLNEHSKLHINGKPQCEYCDRLLADSKSLADHKKICAKCPESADLTEEQRKPHKCPHCYKRYTRSSDVVHHCKSKHPNIKLHPDRCIWRPYGYILHPHSYILHPLRYCARMGICCTCSDVFCAQTDHACSRTDMFAFVLCLCSCIIFFLLPFPCSARVRPQFYSGI